MNITSFFSYIILITGMALVGTIIYKHCINQKDTLMTGQMIKANNIDLWCQTFGDSKNPAVLLMMGNSCDAIMWPEQFCKDLANTGLYVIRFDQRDTGLSTWFDFSKNPYTLLDMVADASGLLDALKIDQAHIVGFSTGGAIAQYFAIHHPEKTLSLTLMMTSMDLTIKNDAFAGKDMSNAAFPPPKKEFIQAILASNANPPKNMHEKVTMFVQNFSLANGDKAPFDRDFFYGLFEESMKRVESRVARSQIGHGSNHALATSATTPVTSQELAGIKVPTLIIAGGQDPIFPSGHAEAMAKIIPGAQLLVIENMGHALSPVFFDQIADAIAKHAQG